MTRVSVRDVPVDRDARIDLPENFIHVGLAGQDRVFARDHDCAAASRGRDECGGQVAGPDVLSQRGGDDRCEVRGYCVLHGAFSQKKKPGLRAPGFLECRCDSSRTGSRRLRLVAGRHRGGRSSQNGRPCVADPMQSSIGTDSTKFVREASIATLRALAFSSSLAGTMPRIFFWLGQIRPQTLNSMIVPSQAPMPITSW